MSDDQYDPDAGNSVYFGDEVTHVQVSDNADPNGDGNEWLGTAPYDPGVENGYEAIFDGGRNTLRERQNIDLPSTSEDIKAEAFGSGPEPSNNGVYISSENGKVTDGIFVKGSLEEVFLGLDEAGNQRINFRDWRDSGQANANAPGGWNPPPIPPVTQPVSFDPPQYQYNQECPGGYIWVDPPPPAGGGGIGEPQGQVQICQGGLQDVQGNEIFDHIVIEPGVDGFWDPDLDNGSSADRDNFSTIVVEAEFATTLKHGGKVMNDPATDQPITVQPGQTLIARIHDDGEVPWADDDRYTIESFEVLDGLPNGTIFIDGDIQGDNNGNWNGLSGITKGTPALAPDGSIKKDDSGNTEYNSKVIATGLGNEINLVGDLLQFDPEKFFGVDANGVPVPDAFPVGQRHTLDDHGDTRILKNVALNPHAADGPELSPTADHVLGIVTRDVWMRAKKHSHDKNGNDGVNDIYGIILAGRTHDSGEVSGGFGTYWRQKSTNNGGGQMGDFAVYGGVIQGTTAANFDGHPERSKHFWINPEGTRGYQVQMTYDKIATYQRLFPTFPEFEVIRYLETSARDQV